MKQLFMKKNPLTSADLVIEEVPVPKCGKGSVLLSNSYSLISAGTETSSVKRNMKDMVVKVLSDPELRDSLKDMILKDGIVKTADRVNYETTKWTPMGYSGAGVAVDVGEEINAVAAGDPVAYGGQGHAEYIRSSKNLCVKVPEGVSAKAASFVAVGSIALQAVRRADVRVGEITAVIGLGLVGQLVSQMLQAAGARVVGSDIIKQRLELAESLGMEKAYMADDKLSENIVRYTKGIGVDHVLVCAGGSGSLVIEQAIAMARDRARITVVGMIDFNMPFEAFYAKELDLVSSRSYGPGRYDAQYEEHGVDYPIGYVRWTEKKNMEEFLRLIQTKKVDVEALITHEFKLSDAAEAYKVLMEKPNECLAIVLRYEHEHKEELLNREVLLKVPRIEVAGKKSTANIAVVGCGAFARQFHLPYIRSNKALVFKTLAASSGQSAKEMAERYGASNSTTDVASVLNDQDIDAVYIFTRDNSHASLTASALKSGKHVFCEKPLATSYEECDLIKEAAKDASRICMVGYNRRYAPLMKPVKEVLGACIGPKMIIYRVNAGPMPRDNWVYDSKFAAGRVVGEVCHFIDLMTHLIGAEPVRVKTHAIGESQSLSELENIQATFDFMDGSVGTVVYTAIGSSSFSKERLEIFADGTSISLDDYVKLTIRGKRRLDTVNRKGDKGHVTELNHFTDALLGKTPSDISYIDGIRGTVGCLKIWESMKEGATLPLNLSEFI